MEYMYENEQKEKEIIQWRLLHTNSKLSYYSAYCNTGLNQSCFVLLKESRKHLKIAAAHDVFHFQSKGVLKDNFMLTMYWYNGT